MLILSGEEDLVPVFRKDPKGNWVRDAAGKLVVHIHDGSRESKLSRRVLRGGGCRKIASLPKQFSRQLL